MLSRDQLFATPWTTAHQAPQSVEFSMQEILEWVAISSSRKWDLPNPWVKSAFPALAGKFFTTCTTWESQWLVLNK